VDFIPIIDIEKLGSMQVAIILLVDANYFVMGYY
jgi:hypothetical protein